MIKKITNWFKKEPLFAKVAITIGLIILFVFIIVTTANLFDRKKTKEKIEIERIAYVQDSTKIALETRLKAIEDSVLHLKYERDSISREKEQYRKDLSSTKSRVKQLLSLRDDFNTIKQTSEDTLRFISECKELRATNKDLLIKLESYEQAQEELNSKNTELMDKIEDIVITKDSMYNELEKNFNNLKSLSLKIEKDLNKYKKQANKRVIFGPIAGATYDGQIKPTAGVGVVIRIGRLF